MTPDLDVAASARAGTDLETLARVPLHQPRPAPRWTLSEAGLQHLWSVRGRGLVGRGTRASAAAREVREAGLTTAFGAPTPEALVVTRCLGAPVATFGAEARHAGRTSRWGYWALEDTGLVKSGPSVAELLDGRDAGGPEDLDLLPLGRAIGRLLAWTGLSPAWAVGEDQPLVLPAEVVDDRIDHPGARAEPAPIDDWAFRRLWDRPSWTQLSGWSDSTRNGFRVVVAGDAGAFRRQGVEGRPDLVQLVPVPTGTVLQDVLAVFLERREAT